MGEEKLPKIYSLTIIDENLAVLTANVWYRQGGIVLWIISLGLFLTGIFTYSYALGPLFFILAGIFVFAGYFSFAHDEKVIIDKKNSKITIGWGFKGLFLHVSRVVGLDEFLQFEARSASGSTPDHISSTLIVKLQTGEEVYSLSHTAMVIPQNCAKYANLFFEGNYAIPGTIYN